MNEHPGNPLLRPGSEALWASIDADDRAAPRHDQSIEQRLIRGQRLSAQAAALRRAVAAGRDDRRP